MGIAKTSPAPRLRTSRPRAALRQGIASILAMMYLMLFALLAVGFYATTGTNAQVAHNEKRRYVSLSAAESGMDFMRYQLAQMKIPPTTPETQVLQEVYNDLSEQLDGTPNLGHMKVGYIPGQSEINIPANKNEWIKLTSDGARFRVVITPYGRRISVKVIGTFADSSLGTLQKAAVQLAYDTQERPTDFFSHGLASRGTVFNDSKVMMTGSPNSHAGILSLATVSPPVTLSDAGIAGDITVVGAHNPSVAAGTSVGGTTSQADIFANHVTHLDPADPPEFPTPDTTPYKQYAVNMYVPGLPAYENVLIPPNTNPTFNGGTIKGVVYVMKPNQIKFNGAVNITGVIVTDGANVGTLLTNTVTFQGNGGSKLGVDELPDLPQFIGLKNLAGSFLVAPGFDVTFTGNFGSVTGHIVGDKVTIKGSSDVSVTGSIVALKHTLTISNNGVLNLIEDPTLGHAGLRFSERYVPLPTTYDEVKP
jgi:hypothetical protein